MFKSIRLKRNNGKLVKVYAQLSMNHSNHLTGALSDTEHQWQRSILLKELTSLISKDLTIRTKRPLKLGDRMFRWMCLYALVAIVIAFLAGCNPVTANTSSDMGNQISFTRDYVNGNVCYVYRSMAISCVPMRE